MIFPADCYKKYGEPTPDNKFLTLWDVPEELEIGVLPKRIYCNKDMVKPLTKAFKALIKSGCVSELKTWDGCFNIRKMRRGNLMSLHSWGVAIDVNAFENGMGREPKLSPEFVKCFTDAGFDWGGNWVSVKDGMHFQLAKIF